jgi:hypothetical protein
MKLAACCILLGAVLVAAHPVHAAPVSTAFTYQGQLQKNGLPYTGTASFVFRLCDDPTAISQVGSVFSASGVTVTGGLFTVDLDFGAVYTGVALWLDIQVLTPGDVSLTTLTPRVALTSVPFAQYALSAPGGGGSQWTNGTNGIHTLGHVGVGTAATSSHVLRVENGSANSNTAYFSSSNGAYPALFVRNFGANGYGFFDDASPQHYLYGNLGLGTTTPGLPLDVYNSGSAGARVTGFGNQFATIPGEGVRAALFVHGNTGSGFGGASMGGIYASSTDARAISGFSNNDWGVSGDCLAAGTYGVLGTPNEGVFGYTPNTSKPAGRFNAPAGGVAIEANGLAKLKTLQIMGGADLAEPFDVARSSGSAPEPGTVVVIDATSPGDLKVSDRAYDLRVAGVISGGNGLAPGMVMQAEGVEHAGGEHPVALTGRVWCKVDAGYGAVHPGDMLTTSPTAGHAMVASDAVRRAGAVIGKAMTSLEDGRGLVLVLVSLQ